MIFNKFFLASIVYCLCSFCIVNASNVSLWIDHWLQGCEYAEQENYHEAIDSYTLALTFLATSTERHLYAHIYNERGLAHVLAGQYLEAIEDYSQAIEKSKTINSDVIFAWWGRFLAYASLNDIEQCAIHYEKLQEIDQNFPKVTFIDNFLMIKTQAYWTNTAKKKFQSIMESIGVCDGEENIVFSPSGVCIVKLSMDFLESQSCEGNTQHGNCMVSAAFPSMLSNFPEGIEAWRSFDLESNDVDACKEHCSTAAYYAALICGVVPNQICRLVCLAAIEPLRRACNWCCESGNFYERCIKPLNNFESPLCEQEGECHE